MNGTTEPTMREIANGRGLCSFAQARQLAAQIGDRIGGGIKPETNNPQDSGIYTLDWLAGPAAFPEPSLYDPNTGEYYYALRFRMNNGVANMQPGYIAAKFTSFPNDPEYVFRYLAEEADKGPKEFPTT